ncbi:RNA 2'-phosphotransferase [Amycolatopsis japonica]|uniref:RNA 2'-phosphotransferase n=1 Tax=Amycolatopsis japonica TaxID=208439 RepID=UPI003670EC89
MDKKHLIRVSKRLSRHLRHAPGDIGITLTPDGWVEVDTFLAALRRNGLKLTRAELDEVVEGNDKRREGLRPMNRHAVHLSATVDTARAVGARRGVPVLLAVDAREMTAAGHEFQVSANGVWLTAAVPPEFLRRLPLDQAVGPQ